MQLPAHELCDHCGHDWALWRQLTRYSKWRLCQRCGERDYMDTLAH